MGNNENMLPQEKEKKGTKKGIAGPGDIGGGLAIGFGTLCFCFWANAMGFCDIRKLMPPMVLSNGIPEYEHNACPTFTAPPNSPKLVANTT